MHHDRNFHQHYWGGIVVATLQKFKQSMPLEIHHRERENLFLESERAPTRKMVELINILTQTRLLLPLTASKTIDRTHFAYANPPHGSWRNNKAIKSACNRNYFEPWIETLFVTLHHMTFTTSPAHTLAVWFWRHLIAYIVSHDDVDDNDRG